MSMYKTWLWSLYSDWAVSPVLVSGLYANFAYSVDNSIIKNYKLGTRWNRYMAVWVVIRKYTKFFAKFIMSLWTKIIKRVLLGRRFWSKVYTSIKRTHEWYHTPVKNDASEYIVLKKILQSRCITSKKYEDNQVNSVKRRFPKGLLFLFSSMLLKKKKRSTTRWNLAFFSPSSALVMQIQIDTRQSHSNESSRVTFSLKLFRRFSYGTQTWANS